MFINLTFKNIENMRSIGMVLALFVAIAHIWTTIIGFQEGGIVGGHYHLCSLLCLKYIG